MKTARWIANAKEAVVLVSSRWRIATLVASALVIGPVICPGPVRAAAASLMRTEGADGTHLAIASSVGQLPAGAGLRTTVTGRVKVPAGRVALASEMSSGLSGVSCTSAVSCMAVGSFTVGDVSTRCWRGICGTARHGP
jgi:hypothetical protein